MFKDTDEWRCDKPDRVLSRRSRGLRGEITTPKFCLKSRLTVSCSADAAPTASVLLSALRRPLRDLADVIICRSRRAGAFKNITAGISHCRRHESTKPASFLPPGLGVKLAETPVHSSSRLPPSARPSPLSGRVGLSVQTLRLKHTHTVLFSPTFRRGSRAALLCSPKETIFPTISKEIKYQRPL